MDMKNSNYNTLPELLSPAGNLERLREALRFGADAVYVGMQKMSLRNFADNFSPEELKEAADLLHSRGKRLHVTLNAYAREEDLKELPPLLELARDAGADALIINDPGVIRMARRLVPDLPLHLSTQANTLNSEACLLWHDLGVQRIVLARELSLGEIRALREKLPDTLELEMFVHGAQCISYSGRCLLSNYIAGRDAYKGECAQPCRWSYEIRERGKDTLPFGMEQEDKGTFLLNARDLNLLPHLREVLDTGVCSLKIEGRMKSTAYVATVTNAYRMALDHLKAHPGEPIPEVILREAMFASHRPYYTGFAFGDPGPLGQYPPNAQYDTDADIAAIVLDYDGERQLLHLEQRNRFFEGDELYILSPSDVGRHFTVTDLRDEEGQPRSAAPHPCERLYAHCPEPVKSGDILRKLRS